MKSSDEVERLLQEVGQRRTFLTKLLKDLRVAREGEDWDAVALARTLESAAKEKGFNDEDIEVFVKELNSSETVK